MTVGSENLNLASCSGGSLVPVSVGHPVTDFDGRSRPNGSAVDAGAYEDC